MYRSIDSATLNVTALDLSWRWLHRVVAALGMAFGLVYWARLIGVDAAAGWRFDLMPVHWQVACVVLAVLYPFAASGLWMISSWGAVIWFLCAATEVLMHAGFPELFGSRPMLIVLHVAVAAVYCGCRVGFFLRRRRQAD